MTTQPTSWCFLYDRSDEAKEVLTLLAKKHSQFLAKVFQAYYGETIKGLHFGAYTPFGTILSPAEALKMLKGEEQGTGSNLDYDKLGKEAGEFIKKSTKEDYENFIKKDDECATNYYTSPLKGEGDTEEESLITSSQINEVWGNSNFGDRSPRFIINDTVFKCACGVPTGSTATAICKELKLINKSYSLTKKGKRYLRLITEIKSKPSPPIRTAEETLKLNWNGSFTFQLRWDGAIKAMEEYAQQFKQK